MHMIVHAGVFNPNIPIYHLPNSAEGLHFSAFHYYYAITSPWFSSHMHVVIHK